jgi:hypothetical protein
MNQVMTANSNSADLHAYAKSRGESVADILKNDRMPTAEHY